jgi:protein SCO1/2
MTRAAPLVPLVLALARVAAAQSGPLPPPSVSPLPPAARAVDIEEHLGLPLPSDLQFTDETGARIALSSQFQDGKPVVLVMTYFHCPMLCSLVLEGTVESMKQLGWKLGDEYRALTVSFDPRDQAPAAGRKQQATLEALGQPDAAAHWKFLVGDEANVRRLTAALGYGYAWDQQTAQYAHAAVIFVLTPDGRIARYLYGIDYAPRDLKLALLEASDGRTGSFVDKILMTCFRYDPASRRYGVYIFGILKIGSVAILIVLTVFLARLWARDRRRQSEETP